MPKIFSFSDIGDVLVSRKSNAKNISLRVHPEKGILLTIPYFAKFSQAEHFILENKDWINSRLSKIAEQRKNKAFSKDSIFETRKITIKFCETDKESENFFAENNGFNINFYYNPQLTDLSKLDNQNFIKTVILRVLKIEASQYLPTRIALLSEQTGLNFQSVKIGSGKSRIGCCSSYNNIILSARLMLLPEHLIDYVILHELCHTIHKDHQAGFHNLLNSFCNGKSLALDKELKTYRFDILPGVYK